MLRKFLAGAAILGCLAFAAPPAANAARIGVYVGPSYPPVYYAPAPTYYAPAYPYGYYHHRHHRHWHRGYYDRWGYWHPAYWGW
jgi:hypothetical protein